MKDWTERSLLMVNRYRFLRAVGELVPQALFDLEENVFPLFKALFCESPSRILGESQVCMPEGGGRWITWRAGKTMLKTGALTLPSWTSEFECSDLEPDRAAFKREVEKWADRYHLNTLWVKDEVFSTFGFWFATRCSRTWQFRGPDPADGAPPLPRIQIDEMWSGDPWRIERKRLLEKLEDYRAEVQKFLKLMGLLHGELHTKNSKHFRWAALYQCANRSPGQIAKSTDGKHESTVMKGVDSLLKTIGLQKRPNVRGCGAKRKM